MVGKPEPLPTEVTTIPAPCACASSSSIPLSNSPLAASRWLTGSSSRMKSNGWHMQRMKATRCCCPKESLSTGASRLSAIPAASSIRPICSCVLKCVSSFFRPIFSATVNSPKRRKSWKSILSDLRRRPLHAAAEKPRPIRPVEEYPPRVILPDAVEKVAQRSFPRSRSSLEQAVLPLAEGHLLQPDPRISRSRFPREHAGQHPLQSYRFHTFFISR